MTTRAASFLAVVALAIACLIALHHPAPRPGDRWRELERRYQRRELQRQRSMPAGVVWT